MTRLVHPPLIAVMVAGERSNPAMGMSPGFLPGRLEVGLGGGGESAMIGHDELHIGMR